MGRPLSRTWSMLVICPDTTCLPRPVSGTHSAFSNGISPQLLHDSVDCFFHVLYEISRPLRRVSCDMLTLHAGIIRQNFLPMGHIEPRGNSPLQCCEDP